MTGSRRYVTRVYIDAEQTENVSRLDHVPNGRRTKARTNARGGEVVVIDVEDRLNLPSNTAGIQTTTLGFELATRHTLPARASPRLARHVYGDGYTLTSCDDDARETHAKAFRVSSHVSSNSRQKNEHS